MKNLKKLNVQEISTTEMKKIDGGLIGWKDVALWAAEYYVKNAHKFSNPNHDKYILGHVGGGRP